MNREQVFQFPLSRLKIDDIEMGAPLTPALRMRAQAQIESGLCIEWWRGYYAAVDLANNLGSARADPCRLSTEAISETIREILSDCVLTIGERAAQRLGELIAEIEGKPCATSS